MSQFSSMSLPIPSSGSELLDILDTSKLNTFADCPRRFFYEYLLGWRYKRPNIHLGFGSAWHSGMEVFMRNQDGERVGYSMDVVMEAYEEFCREYNEIFGREEDEGLLIVDADETTIQLESPGGKTKDNAFKAFAQYAKTYKSDRLRTLWVEVSGATPIFENQLLYFKLDSIVEDGKDGVWSFEHKTTGRKSQAWEDKWALVMQVGTYLHVLSTLYGDNASGIKINGAVLGKPRVDGTVKNEFLRVPIQHTREMQSLWMWEMWELFERLRWNMQMLELATPSDKVMQAFPRNTASCTKFGCAFKGLCERVANPLRVCDEPPIGMKVEFWDPRNRGTEESVTEAKPTEPQETIEAEGGLVMKATRVNQ